MWKRLKSPWTIVLVTVLAFAGGIGRSYHRTRARDELIRELRRGEAQMWSVYDTDT